MLRFYARYKQNAKNVQGTIGDPIRYDMQTGAQVAANTIIVQNTGLVSHPTGFPASPNWYEFTNDIIDGGEIAVKAGGSDKSGEAKRILFTDSEIEVSGEMVRFVAFHLINNPNSKYNAIEVKIEDTTLTIRGERKQDSEIRKENYHRIERYYGTFQRSFSLPQSIDREKVNAACDKGVLTITLPKKEEVKPRQIVVEVN